MSGLKLAVFDVDGTLVDSRQVIHAAMTRAFERAGLGPIAYDRVRTIVGLELSEAVARLAPPDFGEARVIALTGFYKEAFVEQRAERGFSEPLYEGARETVERLCDEGWLLGVATGKARRGLDIVFSHHDLHRHFQTLQTADGGPGKPHPRMVLDAMAETGVRPEDTVVIGDTGWDMTMARNAEVHALGVSWGFHTPDEIMDAGAHAIHHDFAALNAALDLFASTRSAA
ncbi:HAD-IA family hydrolase [Alkalicaulis satelles]|uniref:HAD-IA family hydrolase n=1 Tax=Alkalicaulis satelles TaxID=2609175 RepID=A0A5M6ZQE8_9PROT|nr:HAD-IA family hydrolase [Alkalicaulis satelles]KAA5804481.1 HAD-IA family hydrolase [Alkalicaulis satelles]